MCVIAFDFVCTFIQTNNNNSQIRILPSKGNIKYAYGFAFYPQTVPCRRCSRAAQAPIATMGPETSELRDAHKYTLGHRYKQPNIIKCKKENKLRVAICKDGIGAIQLAFCSHSDWTFC